MRTMQFELEIHAASILCQVMSFFGSLSATLSAWTELVNSLGTDCVDDAANRIVEEAVPIEGDRTLDAHPLRAEWDGVEGCHNDVWFITPGGVKVTIYKNGAKVGVIVDFNRESRYAARCVAGRVYEATGGALEPMTPWDIIEDDSYIRGAMPSRHVLTWSLDPNLDPDPDGSVSIDFDGQTQQWVWHDENGRETYRCEWHG